MLQRIKIAAATAAHLFSSRWARKWMTENDKVRARWVILWASDFDGVFVQCGSFLLHFWAFYFLVPLRFFSFQKMKSMIRLPTWGFWPRPNVKCIRILLIFFFMDNRWNISWAELAELAELLNFIFQFRKEFLNYVELRIWIEGAHVDCGAQTQAIEPHYTLKNQMLLIFSFIPSLCIFLQNILVKYVIKSNERESEYFENLIIDATIVWAIWSGLNAKSRWFYQTVDDFKLFMKGFFRELSYSRPSAEK